MRLARRETDPVLGDDWRYERDLTHAGRDARIPGRQGLFVVHAHETNPRTGASWWMVFGPVGPVESNGQRRKDGGQWVHVREVKLVPLPRRRK